MQAPASLRVLLEHSLDYAGMFPPCSLDLQPAVKNQAGYVRSAESWMLNSFVLSTDRFRSLKEFVSYFDPMHPLKISALGPRTENRLDFTQALARVSDEIHGLSNDKANLISVTQLEMFLPEDVEVAGLNEARSLIADLPAFWESPAARAGRAIDLIAESNSDQAKPAFGFKLRTGGVTPDAFPSSAQIAKALVATATRQVPVKFTAGLHHPIRQFRDEVKAKMHGFLNVLGAAVLTAEHQWNEEQATAMLEDEDAKSFSFGESSFAWRDWKIGIERLRERRQFVASFGSCSFDEPREDLRALNLL